MSFNNRAVFERFPTIPPVPASARQTAYPCWVHKTISTKDTPMRNAWDAAGNRMPDDPGIDAAALSALPRDRVTPVVIRVLTLALIAVVVTIALVLTDCWIEPATEAKGSLQ